MKKKILLLSALVVSSLAFNNIIACEFTFEMQEPRQQLQQEPKKQLEQELKQQPQQEPDQQLEQGSKPKPPQCYCAFKCDYRDVTPEDTPFIDEKNGNICFCAQRDQDKQNGPDKCELPSNPENVQTVCSKNH